MQREILIQAIDKDLALLKLIAHEYNTQDMLIKLRLWPVTDKWDLHRGSANGAIIIDVMQPQSLATILLIPDYFKIE